MKEKDVVISYILDLIDEKTVKIHEHQDAMSGLALRMARLNETIQKLEDEIEQLKALRVVDVEDDDN